MRVWSTNKTEREVDRLKERDREREKKNSTTLLSQSKYAFYNNFIIVMIFFLDFGIITMQEHTFFFRKRS